MKLALFIRERAEKVEKAKERGLAKDTAKGLREAKGQVCSGLGANTSAFWMRCATKPLPQRALPKKRLEWRVMRTALVDLWGFSESGSVTLSFTRLPLRAKLLSLTISPH
jgi:hypothetical protein